MRKTFKLVGRVAVPCSLEDFARSFGDSEMRRVARSEIGPFTISTVFLAIDHNFGGGAPALFETMIVLGSEFTDYSARCATWEQAEGMHDDALFVARGWLRLANREPGPLAPGLVVPWQARAKPGRA